jgi:hypothetical protein
MVGKKKIDIYFSRSSHIRVYFPFTSLHIIIAMNNLYIVQCTYIRVKNENIWKSPHPRSTSLGLSFFCVACRQSCK